MGLFDRKQKVVDVQATKSSTVKSQAANASSAAIYPAAEKRHTVEWPDAGQPVDSTTEQAMIAPSLENVIVTQSRDLSRLSREDLLQLLLTQSKEAEQLQDYLRDVANEFERFTSLNERLREKLDAKDEQIEHLKGRLNDKDKRIELMQARLDELEVLKEEEERHAWIIANAAKGVRSALEAFNTTADWYIASLQEVCEGVGDQVMASSGSPADFSSADNPKVADA